MSPLEAGCSALTADTTRSRSRIVFRRNPNLHGSASAETEAGVALAKYIVFQLVRKSPSGKTYVYKVVNKKHGYELGEIKWFSEWRQYCFTPLETEKSQTLFFSAECLHDIETFLESLMREHESWRKRRLKK